ncbi:AraC family transcriptional regulator [Paenibacillus alba]|uniref:Helix-turn-helix domain-containing protein n=1 Tax=Paenibacillus alba TaxID=1197127 RepID=A0ABU6GEG6_9BACL|nr:helix-turn-helix domain-containing protein [Paenibacillus alba]MEC0232610.1 helix-turn-helix domain-containing protein [Paenibacillus alba]
MPIRCYDKKNNFKAREDPATEDLYRFPNLIQTLQVIGCHFGIKPPGWEYPRHHHHLFELLYCLEGEVVHVINRESVTMREGDWLLIKSGVRHQTTNPSAFNYSYFNVHFDLDDTEIRSLLAATPFRYITREEASGSKLRYYVSELETVMHRNRLIAQEGSAAVAQPTPLRFEDKLLLQSYTLLIVHDVLALFRGQPAPFGQAGVVSGRARAVSGQASVVSEQALAMSGQASGVSEQRFAMGGQASGVSEQRFAMGGQASGVSEQALAMSGQSSGVSEQTLAMGGQPSGVSEQALAMSGQSSGVSEQTLAMGGQPSGVSKQTAAASWQAETASRQAAAPNTRALATSRDASLFTTDVAHAIEEKLSLGLCEETTVAGVAKEMNLSRSQCSKLFSKVYGLSPRQYVSQQKLKLAKELLVTTHLPMTDIADKLGFQSASHFSRQFRRWTGQSPSEFRPKHHAAQPD